jgi:hypothetical protein
MQSIIKRYTPPTCTLKIFSPRFNLIPNQKLNFELHIDDPILPEEQQISLQGNYQQLQLLAIAIQQYIQQFLQSSPVELPQGKTPYLQTLNLLKHQLNWDLLPNHKIELSTTQLFDLANALGQFQQEISQFNTSKPQISKLILIAGISAGSLLLIFATNKLLFSQTTKTVTSTPTTQTVSPEIEPDNIIITPDLPPPALIKKPQLKLPATWQDYSKIQPPTKVQIPPSVTSLNPPTPDNQTVVETQAIAPVATPPNALYSTTLPRVYPGTSSKIVQPDSLTKTFTSPAEEVQVYFQRRWQPPEDLKEKLEYRIIINSRGRIEEMIPIGRISQDHLQSIKPPTTAKIIDSPIKSTQKVSIRLILTPQGIVQTLAEQ